MNFSVIPTAGVSFCYCFINLRKNEQVCILPESKIIDEGPGEMSKWLRALTAFLEDPGSISYLYDGRSDTLF